MLISLVCISRMAPFSIQEALIRIDNEELRENTRVSLEMLNDCMYQMGYGCGVRDDSRLAFNWASCSIRADLHDITEELGFMQWLSDNTSYQATMQETLRNMANALKAEHPDLNWGEVWSIVRSFGPDMIRYIIIEYEHASGVPELIGLGCE